MRRSYTVFCRPGRTHFVVNGVVHVARIEGFPDGEDRVMPMCWESYVLGQEKHVRSITFVVAHATCLWCAQFNVCIERLHFVGDWANAH